jgi:vacuolar-type H+-ATPase subunit H
MKKILKICGIIIAVVLGALLILPSLFKDKVKDVLVSEVSSMLNATLYLEDFSLGFFSNFPHATLSVENFGIVGVAPFENDTLVNVEDLNVVINLASLFKESYEINKIELINPSAKIIVNADSLANWDIMKPTEPEEEVEDTTASSPIKLALDELVVRNLCASYNSVPDSMSASVEGIDLDLEGDVALDLETLVNIDDLQLLIDKVSYSDYSSGDMSAALDNVNLKFGGTVSDRISRMNLALDVDSTSFNMGGVPYLSKARISSDIKMVADLDSNKYSFGENRVSLNEISAKFEGFVHLVDSATTDMDLKVITPSIDFKQILSLIPVIYAKDFESLQTSGEVSLSAMAKGRLKGDTVPNLDAQLNIVDAMFKYPDLPGSVKNINITANVKNPGGNVDLTEVQVPNLSFIMMESPFALTFGLKNPISDPDFNATANGTINLANVSKVVKLEDMDLQGIFTAALKAGGKMSYIDQNRYELFNIDGSLKLADFILKTQSLDYDVEVNNADLGFSSENVNLNANLALGKSDLSLNGKLQHFIQFVTRGETIKGSLAVQSKKIDVNQLLGTSEEEGEPVSDETETPAAESSSSVTLPDNINFALDMAIDSIYYGNVKLASVKGLVDLKDAVANIRTFSANTMGGSLGVTGKYDTQDTLNPKIDVSLDVNDMVINEVFSTVETAKKIVPLFSDAEGNFSLSMDLKSNMDATLTPILETVNAKGSFNSKDISLKNVEAFSALAEKTGMDLFKKPNLKNLSIAFEIKDGRLHIDPFETLISMTKLNVSGSSGLDQTLDYVAKIQLPENVSKVVDLIFDMKIGGTFSKPKISFGASSIKEQVKEKVTEVVDKAKEAAIAAAKEQKEKLVAAAQAQREKLVATAQESADKLVAKAEAERDKNVANAKNPIAKAAAQKAGDALVKKTKEQADKMVSDANKSGDKLVSDAEKSGNALIEKASAGK